MNIGSWGIEIEGIQGDVTARGEWMVFEDGEGAEIKIDPVVVKALCKAYINLKDELWSDSNE